MKTCPVCKMTVHAHSECPMCGADVTSEPESGRKCERYRLNRYFFAYLFKRKTFAPVVTLCVIAKLTAFGFGSFLDAAALVALLAMWVDALFPSLSQRLLGGIYDESHLDFLAKITPPVCGAAAVLFGIFAVIVQKA